LSTDSGDLSYTDVLRLLTEKARGGSVSAMITLERVLRPSDPQTDELDDALDRILHGDLGTDADDR
jgi:hypothetical protein